MVHNCSTSLLETIKNCYRELNIDPVLPQCINIRSVILKNIGYVLKQCKIGPAQPLKVTSIGVYINYHKELKYQLSALFRPILQHLITSISI